MSAVAIDNIMTTMCMFFVLFFVLFFLLNFYLEKRSFYIENCLQFSTSRFNFESSYSKKWKFKAHDKISVLENKSNFELHPVELETLRTNIGHTNKSQHIIEDLGCNKLDINIKFEVLARSLLFELDSRGADKIFIINSESTFGILLNEIVGQDAFISEKMKIDKSLSLLFLSLISLKVAMGKRILESDDFIIDDYLADLNLEWKRELEVLLKQYNNIK